MKLLLCSSAWNKQAFIMITKANLVVLKYCLCFYSRFYNFIMSHLFIYYRGLWLRFLNFSSVQNTRINSRATLSQTNYLQILCCSRSRPHHQLQRKSIVWLTAVIHSLCMSPGAGYRPFDVLPAARTANHSISINTMWICHLTYRNLSSVELSQQLFGAFHVWCCKVQNCLLL